MRLLLLGPPGVGKGTYGKLLAKELQLKVFSLGDMIRDEISTKSVLGNEMAKFSNSGSLIPDEIIINFVKIKLETFSTSVILDGFPRNLVQASEIQVDHVLNLKMRKEYLIQKLLGRRICSNKVCSKDFNIANVLDVSNNVFMPPLLPSSGNFTVCDCGSKLISRKDDSEIIIKNRLNIYDQETSPLIDFYGNLNKIKSFEIKKGLKDFNKILKIVNEMKKSKL